jgi:hypothetical protein
VIEFMPSQLAEEQGRPKAPAYPSWKQTLREIAMACLLTILGVLLLWLFLVLWYVEILGPPTVSCSMPKLAQCPTLFYWQIRWSNPDDFARPKQLRFGEPPSEQNGRLEWNAIGETWFDPDFTAHCWQTPEAEINWAAEITCTYTGDLDD